MANKSQIISIPKGEWGLTCKMSDKVANAALKVIDKRTTIQRTKSTHNGREAYMRAESTTHRAKEGGGSKRVWWPMTRNGDKVNKHQANI
jgi:hypothetical protein